MRSIKPGLSWTANAVKQKQGSYRSGAERMGATSIKPLNLPDFMRGKLRQHVTVSRVDFLHCCRASLVDTHVGIVTISSLRARGKIDDADPHAGKRSSDHVIAVPMAISHSPLPAHLVQARTQRVRRRIIADERISAGHNLWLSAAYREKCGSVLRGHYLTADEYWHLPQVWPITLTPSPWPVFLRAPMN